MQHRDNMGEKNAQNAADESSGMCDRMETRSSLQSLQFNVRIITVTEWLIMI